MESRYADIRKHPGHPLNKLKTTDVIVKGDLHGNALTLLYTLLVEGIIELDEQHYHLFAELYVKYNECEQKLFSFNDIAEFKRIISSIKVIAFPRLIFLGDELCDRQLSDYLTLLVFNVMHQQKLNYEILLSNHGLGFLSAYMNGFKYDVLSVPGQIINSRRVVMRKAYTIADLSRNSQRRSLNHLAGLLYQAEHENVNHNQLRAEIMEMIESAYLPHLRVLACSLEVDMTTPRVKPVVNIFTHAVVNLDIVDRLARLFQTPYKHAAPQDLLQTISRINDKFSSNPKQYLSDLFANDTLPDDSINPLYSITHDRDVNDSDEGMYMPISGEYDVCYVHGHDMRTHDTLHEFSLDNTLGRAVGNYVGGHSIFATDATHLNGLIQYYLFHAQNQLLRIQAGLVNIQAPYREKFANEYKDLIASLNLARASSQDEETRLDMAYRCFIKVIHHQEWSFVLSDFLKIVDTLTSQMKEPATPLTVKIGQQLAKLQAMLVSMVGSIQFDAGYKLYVNHVYQFAEWIDQNMGIDLSFALYHVEKEDSESENDDSNSSEDACDEGAETLNGAGHHRVITPLSIFNQMSSPKRRKTDDIIEPTLGVTYVAVCSSDDARVDLGQSSSVSSKTI